MMSARQTHRFVMICNPRRMLALLVTDRCFPSAMTTRQRPMRLKSATTFLTLLVTAFAADAAPLPAPQSINIPLASGVLHAQLYKPDGDGPFPTVIALHACGGLAGQSEPVQPRYRDWAEQLVKSGNAVLLPDSYASRELGPQCRVKERRIMARRERVADIMA